MRKSDIVKRIAADTFLTPLAARIAVDAVFSEIGEALEKGEQVMIYRFGRFTAVRRGAHVGRNPRTGERVEIPALKSVSFKPSPALKDVLN